MTTPQLLYVTLNEPFPLTCTVRVHFDGNPVNTTIKWIHITTSNLTHGMEPVTGQSPVVANSSEPQYGSDYSSAVLVVESAMESGTFIYQSMLLQVSHSMHVPFIHSLIRSSTGG